MRKFVELGQPLGERRAAARPRRRPRTSTLCCAAGCRAHGGGGEKIAHDAPRAPPTWCACPGGNSR